MSEIIKVESLGEGISVELSGVVDTIVLHGGEHGVEVKIGGVKRGIAIGSSGDFSSAAFYIKILGFV